MDNCCSTHGEEHSPACIGLIVAFILKIKEFWFLNQSRNWTDGWRYRKEGQDRRLACVASYVHAETPL